VTIRSFYFATLLFASISLPAIAVENSPTQGVEPAAVEQSDLWDVAPKFKRGTVPLYPLSFIHGDKNNFAVITYTVTVDGKAKDVILVSTSNPKFGGHIAAAIKRWSHYPATKDGNPVEATVTRRFSLEFE